MTNQPDPAFLKSLDEALKRERIRFKVTADAISDYDFGEDIRLNIEDESFSYSYGDINGVHRATSEHWEMDEARVMWNTPDPELVPSTHETLAVVAVEQPMDQACIAKCYRAGVSPGDVADFDYHNLFIRATLTSVKRYPKTIIVEVDGAQIEVSYFQVFARYSLEMLDRDCDCDIMDCGCDWVMCECEDDCDCDAKAESKVEIPSWQVHGPQFRYVR